MYSQCVGGKTFSRRRMVKKEHIVGGNEFSLWIMVHVDSLLACHGLVFS
jgi:hypothetical protein